MGVKAHTTRRLLKGLCDSVNSYLVKSQSFKKNQIKLQELFGPILCRFKHPFNSESIRFFASYLLWAHLNDGSEKCHMPHNGLERVFFTTALHNYRKRGNLLFVGVDDFFSCRLDKKNPFKQGTSLEKISVFF